MWSRPNVVDCVVPKPNIVYFEETRNQYYGLLSGGDVW